MLVIKYSKEVHNRFLDNTRHLLLFLCQPIIPVLLPFSNLIKEKVGVQMMHQCESMCFPTVHLSTNYLHSHQQSRRTPNHSILGGGWAVLLFAYTVCLLVVLFWALCIRNFLCSLVDHTLSLCFTFCKLGHSRYSYIYFAVGGHFEL